MTFQVGRFRATKVRWAPVSGFFNGLAGSALSAWLLIPLAIIFWPLVPLLLLVMICMPLFGLGGRVAACPHCAGDLLLNENPLSCPHCGHRLERRGGYLLDLTG